MVHINVSSSKKGITEPAHRHCGRRPQPYFFNAQSAVSTWLVAVQESAVSPVLSAAG
jgi:hypothetical protein